MGLMALRWGYDGDRPSHRPTSKKELFTLTRKRRALVRTLARPMTAMFNSSSTAFAPEQFARSNTRGVRVLWALEEMQHAFEPVRLARQANRS